MFYIQSFFIIFICFIIYLFLFNETRWKITIYMDRQFMMNKMHLKKWTWVHKVNTFKNK